jgi:anti-anti-sigma regulatory factor
VLRLAAGVVVVRRAGAVDEARAGEIFEALLGAVARQQTNTAILDLDGQSELSGPVAQLLLRVAHALRLLGAQAVVTGGAPDLRPALETLGLQGLGISLHPTLQDGVDLALRQPARRP